MDYRLKKDNEQTLYECFVAESLDVMSAGMKRTGLFDYIKKRNAIWGEKEKEDTRSARQIIDDTFKKHGLKIKKSEAVNEPV